jgi:hypothetical protein
MKNCIRIKLTKSQTEQLKPFENVIKKRYEDFKTGGGDKRAAILGQTCDGNSHIDFHLVSHSASHYVNCVLHYDTEFHHLKIEGD